MATFTVIYDANVLYPAPLRSVLMFLAQTDLFRMRWTLAIHEEWIRNLLLNRPDLNREKLEGLRDLMIEAIPDSLVTGYEPAIENLVLPDPNDRHVLAAALRANAEVIVTNNLKDFPPMRLRPFNVIAQHPDDFVLDLIDLNAPVVLACFKEDRHHYRSPPYGVGEYIENLLRQGLSKTAAFLSEYRHLI